MGNLKLTYGNVLNANIDAILLTVDGEMVVASENAAMETLPMFLHDADQVCWIVRGDKKKWISVVPWRTIHSSMPAIL